MASFYQSYPTLQATSPAGSKSPTRSAASRSSPDSNRSAIASLCEQPDVAKESRSTGRSRRDRTSTKSDPSSESKMLSTQSFLSLLCEFVLISSLQFPLNKQAASDSGESLTAFGERSTGRVRSRRWSLTRPATEGSSNVLSAPPGTSAGRYSPP